MRRVVMNSTSSRPLRSAGGRLLLVAAVASLTLVGCTGGDPATSPSPEGPSGPVSLVGAECAELVSLDVVRGILNDSVEPVDNFFYPGGSWPVASVGLQQAGGLQCEWSDEANQQGDYEALLEIDILPNAADEWGEWFPSMTGFYQNVSDDGTMLSLCNSSLGGAYHYCDFEVFAGGNWATVSVGNIAPDADAAAIAESVAAALEAASAPAVEWTPPALEGLPSTCEDLLPLETIRTVLGVDDMDVREEPLLMPYLHNTGLDGALSCSWSNPYTSAIGSPLQVVVLPGGGWAWDEAWAADRPDTSPALPVEELGDAAFAGCQTIDNPPCFVDVLVGDAWISLDGKGAADERTLTELATQVLANLAS